MSPGGSFKDAKRYGFTRVSGDEPLAIRWGALNEVFSPREWG